MKIFAIIATSLTMLAALAFICAAVLIQVLDVEKFTWREFRKRLGPSLFLLIFGFSIGTAALLAMEYINKYG